MSWQKLLQKLSSFLRFGWVAGLTGKNASVNTWRTFYHNVIKNQFKCFPGQSYWYAADQIGKCIYKTIKKELAKSLSCNRISVQDSVLVLPKMNFLKTDFGVLSNFVHVWKFCQRISWLLCSLHSPNDNGFLLKLLLTDLAMDCELKFAC